MIICWNCRGTTNTNFAATCKDLRLKYRPQVMIFVETWVSGEKADVIIRNLGFRFNIRQGAEGFSGGIWICWSDPLVHIQVISQHKQMVHCRTKINDFDGYLTAVYGSPNSMARKELWDSIGDISGTLNDPWILIGDFNSFLHPENICGGRPVTLDQCQGFADCVSDSGLLEIETRGLEFT